MIRPTSCTIREAPIVTSFVITTDCSMTNWAACLKGSPTTPWSWSSRPTAPSDVKEDSASTNG